MTNQSVDINLGKPSLKITDRNEYIFTVVTWLSIVTRWPTFMQPFFGHTWNHKWDHPQQLHHNGYPRSVNHAYFVEPQYLTHVLLFIFEQTRVHACLCRQALVQVKHWKEDPSKQNKCFVLAFWSDLGHIVVGMKHLTNTAMSQISPQNLECYQGSIWVSRMSWFCLGAGDTWMIWPRSMETNLTHQGMSHI